MKARGLVWDIETSYYVIKSWGVWQTDALEVIQPPQILTVAWQWVGENKVHVKGQDDFKGYKAGVNDDRHIVSLIRDLLDECDYEVSHNGDQFDVKMANYRMMIHGLQPPTPYKQIDTKKIFKRVGKFPSNSLKNLAKDFGTNQKGDPGGLKTWDGCLAGDKKAWKKMKKYNKADIPPLMDLHLLSRPWDKQAFPVNVFEGRPDGCPKCGGEMKAGMKYRATNTNLYQYFRCMECGGTAKGRIPEKLNRVTYVN